MFQRSRRQLVMPFLLPQTLLYLTLSIVPLALTVIYGFTEWQSRGTAPRLIGLENFSMMIRDHLFFNAMRNSIYLVVVGGVILFIPAFAIAWCLSQPIRFRQFFRFIILAPVAISVSVAGLIWKWIYNPTHGLINSLLRWVGLDQFAIAWLGEPATALTAIIVASIWHGIGTWVLLISAGLDRIPRDFIDAARVDGAGEWHVFIYITIPLIWEVLRILLVLWIIQALQAFTFIYVMTGPVGIGGPLNSTEVMGTYVFKTAFTSFNWGYGAALATSMLILIFLVSTVGNKAMNRENIEY